LSLPKSVYKRLPKRMPHSLGFSRYGLHFNGVDQNVEVPNDASLNPAHITVCHFFKSFASFWQNLARKRNQYLTNIGSDGDPQFRFYVGGTEYILRGPTGYYDGDWHHIAGTYDGSIGILYVDGKREDSDSSMSGDLDTTTNSFFPGEANSGNGEAFVLDAVFVFNRTLSQKEIQDLMLNYHSPIKDGLVGWWRFGEGTGLTAHDRSGNGNDGTLNPSDDPPIWTDVKKWEMRAEAGL